MDLCLEHDPGYWVIQEQRDDIIEVPQGYQVTKIKIQNSLNTGYTYYVRLTLNLLG